MDEVRNSTPSNRFLTPIAIVVAGIIVAAAVLVSNGSINIPGLSTSQNNDNDGPTVPPEGANEANEPSVYKVSVDDDPVQGNPDAPITIVEFSDYECPYCKSAYMNAVKQIKKNYIDTGKVKLVYRDLPLPFHDPMATTEAVAANCAREQGGDETYFTFHDQMFERTKSNGSGLSIDDLKTIAADIGLNVSDFRICLNENRYMDEVQSDVSYAASVNATGTPTFFVGKSSRSGVIEAKMISGAQPYSVFKAEIDALLR